MVRSRASSSGSRAHWPTDKATRGRTMSAEREGGSDPPNQEKKMATTQLNPSEISELIKTRIEKVKLSAESRNEGSVTSVSDGIVRIHGLADVVLCEVIGLLLMTVALALILGRDLVGVLVLVDYESRVVGDDANTPCRHLDEPVGPELLGRAVNALGEPIDGKGPI